jgi:hypothetical protein
MENKTETEKREQRAKCVQEYNKRQTIASVEIGTYTGKGFRTYNKREILSVERGNKVKTLPTTQISVFRKKVCVQENITGSKGRGKVKVNELQCSVKVLPLL